MAESPQAMRRPGKSGAVNRTAASCQRRWQANCAGHALQALLPRPGKSFYGPGMAILSIRLAAPVIALLALSACNADRSRFPSLAIRPAERAYGTGQPVTPTPSLPLTTQLPASTDLGARIAALGDVARAAHGRFLERQGPATQLIESAKGAAPGTEVWSRAAIAFAGLTSARGEGMLALSDLDRLLIAATEKAAIGSDDDLKRVKPAHNEVAALIAEEDRAIAALGGELGN